MQRLVCARVVGARAEAGARALDAPPSTRWTAARDSVAAHAARASGGLDVVVQTWATRAGGPRTRTSESRLRGGADVRCARSGARPGATGRARAPPVRRLRGAAAGALEAAAAEDASGAFATRSVDTAAPTRSACRRFGLSDVRRVAGSGRRDYRRVARGGVRRPSRVRRRGSRRPGGGGRRPRVRPRRARGPVTGDRAHGVGVHRRPERALEPRRKRASFGSVLRRTAFSGYTRRSATRTRSALVRLRGGRVGGFGH